MQECFLLTNMTPQTKSLNERHTAWQDSKNTSVASPWAAEVWVFTGPAFVPDKGTIMIKTLGAQWVPTHCFNFCGTYLDKPFAVRPFEEVADDVTGLPETAKRRVERVFLADGDALALSPRRLHEILDLLHRELPGLRRVASYANARNLLAKNVEELARLRERGLTLLYLGLESGDDQTLADIHKGMTVAEQIEGCRRAKDAGLSLSVTAILGLAGRARSLEHGRATGEALSAIDPDYIGILTLMLVSGTEMHRKVVAGEVVLPDQIGMLRELREIVAHLDVGDCLFRSNHASNYLPVGGHLPGDKSFMLATLDKVLKAPESVQLRPESWRLL